MQGIEPPVLIFVQSQERATELFQELIYDGINVDVIHAGRSQAQVVYLFIINFHFLILYKFMEFTERNMGILAFL